MGDTADGSWTSGELGIHIVKERIKMREQERLDAVEIIGKKIAGLQTLPSLDADAWPTFTGLPSSTLPMVLEWALDNNVSPFDLLMTVAAIAFHHGRDQVSTKTITNAESRLLQAYHMRSAFHSFPEAKRLWEYCKWLDDEVALREKEAENISVAISEATDIAKSASDTIS